MDDVHCFDPVKEDWTLVETSGDIPTVRSVFSTVRIGGHIYIYGGEVDPSDLGHMGAGHFAGDGYVLDTEKGAWKRLGDGAAHGDHPGPSGWCAFAYGRLGGKDGLLVYGRNSPSNDRLDDMFFFTLLISTT